MKKEVEMNLESFWDTTEYHTREYVEKPLTDEMIASAESKLGYKLPKSYIELMKVQNGGKPVRNSWLKKDAQPNEINIKGDISFLGIGSEKSNSLFGQFGNEFWFTEWEYPRNVGVIIADDETGGHSMIYLDYRECGSEGEPKVSICLNESDNEIQVLADSFEEFITKLVSNEEIIKYLESFNY